MSAQFSMRGISLVKMHLTNAAAKGRTILGERMLKFGEMIMNDSKEHYVPVEYGDLRDTGTVREVSHGIGMNVEIRLSYGGGDTTGRAIAIHELPNYNPPSWGDRSDLNWTKAGTGSKYLELPVMHHSAEVPAVVAEALVMVLK